MSTYRHSLLLTKIHEIGEVNSVVSSSNAAVDTIDKVFVRVAFWYSYVSSQSCLFMFQHTGERETNI
jgi:hypothetical protein